MDKIEWPDYKLGGSDPDSCLNCGKDTWARAFEKFSKIRPQKPVLTCSRCEHEWKPEPIIEPTMDQIRLALESHTRESYTGPVDNGVGWELVKDMKDVATGKQCSDHPTYDLIWKLKRPYCLRGHHYVEKKDD